MPMPLQSNRHSISQIETGQLPASELGQDPAVVEAVEAVEVEVGMVAVGAGEEGK